MRITFRLAWHKPGAPAARAFRLAGAGAAFLEFQGRVSRFAPCDTAGGLPERAPGARLWLLDTTAGARVLSSEEVAERLSRVKDGGAKRLEVLVGPADGFSAAEVAALRPDLRWSLGPLTLPHELAAVVAAEQLYRAFTILSRSPYHLAH